MDATQTDDASLIGDACHIIAGSSDGPRGISPLSGEERDRYANLILLCKVHHKQVDDQRNTFSVDVLRQMKEEHEEWVDSSLNESDRAKQRDLEVYATYVEDWSKLADIENWRAWTSWLLGAGQPSLLIEKEREIETLRDWMFSRIWPRRLPELEDAFENFRLVLGDLHETFRKYAEKRGDVLMTRKFYKDADDCELEDRYSMERAFDSHVDLVCDLTLELTRAGNYVCDRVRRYLDPGFRMREGVLVVESGPGMDLRYRRYRPEYRDEERVSIPYPGLEDFLETRFERDLCFGRREGDDMIQVKDC